MISLQRKVIEMHLNFEFISSFKNAKHMYPMKNDRNLLTFKYVFSKIK